MKTMRNAVLLLAGTLTVSSPLFAKNGADDTNGTSGTSGSSGTAGTAGTSATSGTSGTTGTTGTSGTTGTTGTSGTTGTTGTSGTTETTGTSGTTGTTGTSGTTGTTGTSGTTGTTGTSGTTGTTGTSGTTGTTGTSGTFGSANLNQKVLANFNDQLLIVPCIDVKNSSFDDHYHVVFGLSGDNSGKDWAVKEVKNTTADTCDKSNASSLELLQTLASSDAGSSGTSGTSGHTKKVIADFKENLLVMPCVEVKSSSSKSYYHVAMQLAGDKSGSRWELKGVKSTTSGACEYNEDEDISSDRVLQANNLSSVDALKQK
ncbi:MAG: hypothetical protein ABL903_13685 [Methylococcales bacterium]